MFMSTKSFDIRCCKCHKKITVLSEGSVLEVFSQDHGDDCMGIEGIYEFKQELCCPKCGQNIEVTCTGSEYPAGCFNDAWYEISGADFLKTPSIAVFDYCKFNTDKQDIKQTGVYELIDRISKDKKFMYKISPRDFEKVVEQVFRDEGFDTRLTQQTRDGGVDIIATKTDPFGESIVFYIECKRYASQNKVNVELIRELFGVMQADRVNKGYLITTSDFSKDAREFIGKQEKLLTLVDGNKIYEMIKRVAQKHNM